MDQNNTSDTSLTYKYIFHYPGTSNNTGTSNIGGYWQTTSDGFKVWAFNQAVDTLHAMGQKNIIKTPYKKGDNGQLYFDI